MDSSNWPPSFGNSSDGHTSSSSFSSYTTTGGSSGFQGFPDFGSLPESSFSSHTQSFSMDSSKAFYLASVSNGHVLAHQENARPSGVVVENKGDRDDEQKWTVEYGDEPNTVALKCAANGKYLHCFEGKSWGKVGTGDKQWWKISDDDVSPPGACRLCPVDFPEVYLNHHSGNTVRRGAAGTKVHMYKWEQNNERHTTWYFTDTSASFSPGASSSSTAGATKADFDSKLKALEDREAVLTQKDTDRSAEWDKKMKELQDRQESSAKDEKDRSATYDKNLKDLQAREAELAKKEEQAKGKADKKGGDDVKDQAGKDADTQRKLDDLKSTEQKVAADRAALEKSKNDLAAKEKEFQQRQKEFEDQKSAAQQDAAQAKKDLEQRQNEVQSQKPSTGKKAPSSANGSTANGTNGSPEADLQKKQRENASLEQRLAKLEDQLAKMSSSNDQNEKPQVNGTAKSPASNGAGSTGCGYRHYKPPRKLNRKLIGMVYE